MCKGEFPQYKINEYKKRGINLEISDEDKEAFKKSHLDFIGVNYYGSSVISTTEEIISLEVRIIHILTK